MAGTLESLTDMLIKQIRANNSSGDPVDYKIAADYHATSNQSLDERYQAKGSYASTDIFTTEKNGLVPKSGDNTTKFLKGNGTWDTPADTRVTAVGNHYTPSANSSAALSADASSSTAATWNSTSLVTGVNLQRDAAGHVTGVTVDSIKIPDNPNTTGKNVIGVQNATSNSQQSTNGNVYLTHLDGGAAVSSHQIKGDGKVTVTSDANGNITINGAQTTLADLGLSNAMHYRGTSTQQITDGGSQTPVISGVDFSKNPLTAGDVVLYGNQEFIYNSSGKWELFGDEGSYLLASKVSTTKLGGNGAAGGSSNTTKIYGVQEDASGKLAVYVPWINTTYSASGDGISENNQIFSLSLLNTTKATSAASKVNTVSKIYPVLLDSAGKLAVGVPEHTHSTNIPSKTVSATTEISGTYSIDVSHDHTFTGSSVISDGPSGTPTDAYTGIKTPGKINASVDLNGTLSFSFTDPIFNTTQVANESHTHNVTAQGTVNSKTLTKNGSVNITDNGHIHNLDTTSNTLATVTSGNQSA